ncbi:MAG: hypothetical protein Q9M23_07810, partial [Mariprofundaceae bacterium]|nr:hypothetical protein [Mariprofundaceae bacterium]
VFFRAESFSGAWIMLTGMVGMNGISLPVSLAGKSGFLESIHLTVLADGWFPATQFRIAEVLKFLSLGLVVVWFFPNMREVFSHYQSTWDDVSGKLPTYRSGWLFSRLIWREGMASAIFLGALFAGTLLYMMSGRSSEFLYFQF